MHVPVLKYSFHSFTAKKETHKRYYSECTKGESRVRPKENRSTGTLTGGTGAGPPKRPCLGVEYRFDPPAMTRVRERRRDLKFSTGHRIGGAERSDRSQIRPQKR